MNFSKAADKLWAGNMKGLVTRGIYWIFLLSSISSNPTSPTHTPTPFIGKADSGMKTSKTKLVKAAAFTRNCPVVETT